MFLGITDLKTIIIYPHTIVSPYVLNRFIVNDKNEKTISIDGPSNRFDG